MTKRELAAKVARKTGIQANAVKLIIEEAAEEIMRCLEDGDNYYQRGFGSFEIVKRRAKPARNIITGEKIMIPEHKEPKFHPSDYFLERIK
jgi:nucleoid DNA-binding protein